MVTEETESKFARKGVTLVTPEVGRGLFRDALTHPGGVNIELVCGAGPWVQREAELFQIERASRTGAAAVLGPLLDSAAVTTLPNGDKIVAFSIGDNHAYLQEHCLDDVPILPAAAALEIMSEAANRLWPGWVVTEARDCRALKGIEIRAKNQKLSMSVHRPASDTDDRDGFDVTVSIQSDKVNGSAARIHYRALLRLGQRLPGGHKYRPRSYAEKELTVRKAYDEWLFHGPRFQVIERIDGLSDEGAGALLRTSSPAQWLAHVNPGQDQWVFDPAVVDAAAQMALLWARAFRNESALPVRFGRVVRFSSTLPGKLYMHFERIVSDESHVVRADVYFTDDGGNVVFLIEDMECVSSAELNRLGGTAKINSPAPAKEE
jgi:hypothetical protein